MTRRIIIAAVVGVLVASAATGFWLQSRQDDDVGLKDSACRRAALPVADRPGPPATRHDGTTVPPLYDPGEAPPGWELVATARRDHTIQWTFENDFLAAPTEGERLVGVERPAEALDVRRIWSQSPAGQPGHSQRQVILLGMAWIEDAAAGERVTCTLKPTDVPADVVSSGPDVDWGIAQAPQGSWYPNPFRNSPAVARRIGERQQAGETLTLYEMKPDPGLEHLHSEFAVDARQVVRFQEVRDTRTNEVVQRRQVDPAPDHPPIVDPSGQPVITNG